MTEKLPLDPHKTPWKRGDFVTSNFKNAGFVRALTTEYLEIRWQDRDDGTGDIQKVSMSAADWLFRVEHADHVGPNNRTNLENLETLESLARISNGIAERMKTVTKASEKRQLDRLARRLFGEHECPWDNRNGGRLLQLLLKPDGVSVIFKLRERLHRSFCKIQ